jgi:glutamate dehydrogenase (NAD(P)+)
MKEFLYRVLPEQALVSRRRREGPFCYLEFEKKDTELLRSLGVQSDGYGPTKVVCMWDEAHPLDIGGYLVVDNLDMGKPALGGIRFLDPPGKERASSDPCCVFNLARGMTLKNAAAGLDFGGGKAGIVRPERPLTRAERDSLIERFALMIQPYAAIYNPGPDVGITDTDMRTIAIVNGLDNVVSKPSEMGGNQIDLYGGAARGVVIAIETLLKKFHLLKKLPQFKGVRVPRGRNLTVIIQGFGAVGAHTAHFLTSGKDAKEKPRIVGISDEFGFIYCEDGLPVEKLFARWMEKVRSNEKSPLAVAPFIAETARRELRDAHKDIFFSNNSNNLLRESAFCFVPATPVRNYLGVDLHDKPLMTVDKMGEWRMIVEGANTYAPDEVRKRARKHMEREVYRNKGVMIATDYLVNSGGVIFATFERIIPTPEHLQVPPQYLGDRQAVEGWLQEHRDEFAKLARKRLKAAEAHLENVIKRNITELVDLLVEEPSLLPCDAAELIALNRIDARKRQVRAGHIMAEIPTIAEDAVRSQVARKLVESNSYIVAVVSAEGKLRGVITHWDLTKSFDEHPRKDVPVRTFMTSKVTYVRLDETIETCARLLETYNISALPVVDGERVVGMVCGDILARCTLCTPFRYHLSHQGAELDGGA